MGIKNSRKHKDREFKKTSTPKFVRHGDKNAHSRERLNERNNFCGLTVTIRNIQKWLHSGKARATRSKIKGRINVIVSKDGENVLIVLNSKMTEIITYYPLKN